MRNVVRFAVVLGACSAALVSGCASDKKMSESSGDKNVVAVNKTCPVRGGPVDPAVHETYNGKTVGFCCTGCEGKFEKMTSAQKDEVLKKAMAGK